MRRHHRIRDAVDKTILLQGLQRLRQHLFADPAHFAPQIAEAMGSFAQRHQNQHAPAAGDMFKHIARRALFRKQIAIAQFLAQRRFGHFHTYLFVRTY